MKESEHLYNIQRTKRVYNEMILEGLPAVLDVIWATNEDLEYWIKEIKINYICLFDYLFISSQMSAKPYFIGSTGILLLW